MTGKSCSAGCLALFGAFFLFCGLYNLFSELAVGLFLAFFGAVPLLGAWSLLKSDRADNAARVQRVRQHKERALLQAAAQNHGVLTPAMAAMSGVVTVAEAKTLLDELAGAGFCAVDSDANGNLHYRFDFGQSASVSGGANLSPEQWVTAMSQRRMTGDAAAAGTVSNLGDR
ncbi:MAG: hypothetical protein IT204_09665 [Fimbriimonadaceae bacterium]|nr:hypothetical protein [Fimbriimonadaceae bacterium]